ncbi:MAG: DUF58 domain-containing protein [Planctomycetota bacterium]|nr:MAG: DUF58 domain-containing protein [Planctomycetota bacterium]
MKWNLTPAGRVMAFFLILLPILFGLSDPRLILLWIPLAAFFLASPLLGRMNLQGLQAETTHRKKIHAGEDFLLPLQVTRKPGTPIGRDLNLYLRVGPRQRFWAQIATMVPGRHLIQAPLRLPHRGRFTTLQLVWRSSYPFGLFEWSRHQVIKVDLLAWPRLGIMRNLEGLLGSVEAQRHPSHVPSASGYGEFYGLRAWRRGMSQRFVHWKTSARQGQIILQEMEQHRQPKLSVILDCQVPNFETTYRRPPGFELAVSLTATLLKELHRRRWNADLQILGSLGVTIMREQRGTAGLIQQLDRLAVAQAATSDDIEGQSGDLAPTSSPFPLLVIQARHANRPPPAKRRTGSRSPRVYLDTRCPWIRKYFEPRMPS